MKTIKNLCNTVKYENSSKDNNIMSYEEFTKIMEDRKNVHIDYLISQQYHICYRPYQPYW